MDGMGNKVLERGQRPDTSYSRAFGGGPNGLLQPPVMQPVGNQVLFPSITTAPLVQTQTVNMDGKPQTKAVIVPSTQSLIPPPSTLLTSSFASLPGGGPPLLPSNTPAAVGVAPTPIHRSQYLRGSGSGIIGAGDGLNEDFEKMKKAKLRNDLLNQMNDNASRRLDERRMKSWQDEYDDARIFHDNWEQQRRYDHEEWNRKKYLVKDGHLPGPGGRWHPSRYGYRHGSRYGPRYFSSRRGKRRDGNDDYGWWYGGPATSRHPRAHRSRYHDWYDPPPLPWMENQVHVNSGNKGVGSDIDPVAFYKGDMKDWWDKYVPANIASKISTMVNDQLLSMQKKLDNQELSIQKEITRLKTDANNSDNERLKVLNQLRN